MTIHIPADPPEFDGSVVQDLIRTKHPDVTVLRTNVVDAAMASNDGQQVSSARRIGLEVEYGRSSPRDLPTRLIIKIARPDFGDLPLYRNEVNAYLRLVDEFPVQTPQCLGGYHDGVAGVFALVLEDLRSNNVRFESVQSPMAAADVKLLLGQLAQLHAKYWSSTRFAHDLNWVLPHTSGPIHDIFTDPHLIPALVEYEVAAQQFKREFVEFVEETPSSLLTKVAVARDHQAALEQTLLHGDCHVGNTYRNADGSRGLLDWQLLARGYCMHDVTYLIITALSVGDRRAHEHDLIEYYRDRLVDAGVSSAPPLQRLLQEHRVAAAWCLYIGWLSTPLDNYGWQISVANHIRLATAYHDLGTKEAIDGLRVGHIEARQS